MPTVPSRGPYGYRDYQRQENWDGAPITSGLVHLEPGKEFTENLVPETDVSRYASVQGIMTCTEGEVLVVVEWLSEPTGGTGVGRREFWMRANRGNVAFYRFSNQGPGMYISIAGKAAKNKFAGTCIATNRVPVTEVTARSEQVHSAGSVYKANEQKEFLITELATGTAHVVLNASAGKACNVGLLWITPAGAELYLGFVNLVAEIGNLPTTGEIHVPLGPLRVVVTNGPNEQTIQSQVNIAP
jgi:hypothetical protein